MMDQKIKSVEELCEYINESNRNWVEVEDIIYRNNWVSFCGYKKHPEYVCTDGKYLLLKGSEGVDVRSIDGDFIEDIICEIMENTNIDLYGNNLRILDGLRKLELHKERKRLGDRVSNLRMNKGLKQAELAEASSVDRTNIAKIERGRYNASFDILSRICRALGSVLDILTVEEFNELKIIRATLQAKKIFESNDAGTEDIKIFGDWAVNSCGDLVNYTKAYPLYCNYLIPFGRDDNSALEYWHDHISKKYDYDEEHFSEAFMYALLVMEK